MIRPLAFALALVAALPAAAGEAVPEAYEKQLAAGLPAGQRLVQTLVGDLDGDGRPEWIAIGEPPPSDSGAVSVAIFAPAASGKPPELRFAQTFDHGGIKRAAAVVRRIEPIGEAVVLVAALPNRGGNSLFLVQIYGWTGSRFKPMAPELINFRTQGGFAIEDVDPETPGDEIVIWSFVQEESELLFDYHRYSSQIYRWDGQRFASPQFPTRSEEKYVDPAEAGRALGVKQDLRRQIERIAEVP